MLKEFKPALILLIALSVLTGMIYPALVTGLANVVFPNQANGSLLENEGKIVGSRLIGQNFADPGHFWGRPSATGPMPYNASGSSGSNQGPLNPALVDAVDLAGAGGGDHLVTASASGLDPHISVAAALWQVPRIAGQRRLAETEITSLVSKHTEGRQWGLLGEPRVNVLALNLALDKLAKH